MCRLNMQLTEIQEKINTFNQLIFTERTDKVGILLKYIRDYLQLDGVFIVEVFLKNETNAEVEQDLEQKKSARIIAGKILEEDLMSMAYDIETSPLLKQNPENLQGNSIWIDNLSTEFPKHCLLSKLPIQFYQAFELNMSSQLSRFLILVDRKSRAISENTLYFIQQCLPVLTAMLEIQQLKVELDSEKKLTKAQLDAIPALVYIFNKNGQFLRWNRYYQELTGYTDEEMETLHGLDTIHPDDKEKVAAGMEKVFKEGKATLVYTAYSKKKIKRTMFGMAERINYQGEDVLIGVATDISAQKKIEEDLRLSENKLKKSNKRLMLLKSLSDRLHNLMNVEAIADEVLEIFAEISDAEKSVFRVNKLNEQENELHIIASRGFSQEILALQAITQVGNVNEPSGIATAKNQIATFGSLEDAKNLTSTFTRLIKKEGINSGIIIPLSYNGKILGVVSLAFLYEQKFEQEQLEFYKSVGASVSLALNNARQFEKVQYQAKHDSLTDLPNRVSLHDDCKLALEENKLSSDYTGLLLLDLDHFKEINDTLGHHVGDALLCKVGSLIESILENTHSRIYRLGGDEFAVLIPDHKTIEDIHHQAEKIQKLLQQAIDIDDLQLEINASIGMSSSIQGLVDIHELLRCADMAMYAAKNSGSGIAVYKPEMEFLTPERKAILADLSEAIRTDQLFLQYQPIWDFKTNSFIACEALIRWNHPEYGLLFPDKFIPIVEITKMIHPMTIWVFEKVCQQINQWKGQGLELKVTINISTRNLLDDSCEEKFAQLMKQYQIKPNNISLEVTETALMHDPERTLTYIKNINNMGLQFSLDDFGTGHSSLTYLRKLSFQTLKIDRSFVIDMARIPQNKIIVESTINLAHNLKMNVVAEGVEDKETLKQLEDLGCDFAQGYFMSHPLNADEFIQFILQHQSK